MWEGAAGGGWWTSRLPVVPTEQEDRASVSRLSERAVSGSARTPHELPAGCFPCRQMASLCARRPRSCLFSSCVSNCWQWRRESAAAGQWVCIIGRNSCVRNFHAVKGAVLEISLGHKHDIARCFLQPSVFLRHLSLTNKLRNKWVLRRISAYHNSNQNIPGRSCVISKLASTVSIPRVSESQTGTRHFLWDHRRSAWRSFDTVRFWRSGAQVQETQGSSCSYPEHLMGAAHTATTFWSAKERWMKSWCHNSWRSASTVHTKQENHFGFIRNPQKLKSDQLKDVSTNFRLLCTFH